MSDLVTIEVKNHVADVRLNRPEKMNAISEELAWGVLEAVVDASTDDDTWVIGLTGSGNAFCAGLDLTGSSYESDRGPRCLWRMNGARPRSGAD